MPIPTPSSTTRRLRNVGRGPCIAVATDGIAPVSLANAALSIRREEALRYEPITPFTARLLTEDLSYDGVDFPAGTVVSVCAFTANRDPGAFAEPDFPPPRISVWESRRHPWVGLPAEIEHLD